MMTPHLRLSYQSCSLCSSPGRRESMLIPTHWKKTLFSRGWSRCHWTLPLFGPIGNGGFSDNTLNQLIFMKFIIEQNNGLHGDIFLQTCYKLWDHVSLPLSPFPSHLALPPQTVLPELSAFFIKILAKLWENHALSVSLRLAYFMVTSSSAHRPASDMVLFFFMTVMLHYRLLDFWWCQEEAAMSLFGQRLEDLKGCYMRKRDQLSRWSTGCGNFSQSTHTVQGDWAGRYLISISLHWPPARCTLPADAVPGVFWNPLNLL